MKDAITYANEAGFFSFNVLGWKAEFERLIEAVRADAVADHIPDATKMVKGYDFSNVINLTHNKAQHIIQRDGYVVTGFVLTKNRELEHYSKCIVDMSAVHWFDDGMVFFRMMHSDTPKEWMNPPEVDLSMKECRHCGWLCKPNDSQSKPWYVLPQENDKPVLDVSKVDADLSQDFELSVAAEPVQEPVIPAFLRRPGSFGHE